MKLNRQVVRKLLDDWELPAESSLHGFELFRPNGEHWRLQHGGGISGDGDRVWWMCCVQGSDPPVGDKAVNLAGLKRLLIEWAAGPRIPPKDGFRYFARRTHTRFGPKYSWVERRKT